MKFYTNLKLSTHKEVTLQDLQHEVNQIKIEIKNLKDKNKALEREVMILKID
jgi:hypothetical protein